MTNEELQQLIAKQPETFNSGDGTEWYTQVVCVKPWFTMRDVSNILESIPDDAIENDHLSQRYDNVVLVNKGCTPSKEDFERLLSSYNKIEVIDAEGILLSYDDNYMYLCPGRYWTNSFEMDDQGKLHPIHVIIAHGELRFSTDFEFRKPLNFLGILK